MSVDSPVSLYEVDRGFILQMYRLAVAHYQPQIEQRTGVKLGNIAVRDYSQLLQHLPGSSRVAFALSRLMFPRRWRAIQDRHEDRGTKISACYFRDAVYVSFVGKTYHEDFLAAIVIHELAHALWERIAGRPLHIKPWKTSRAVQFNLLSEGFATYAERIWFFEFYPTAARMYAVRPLDPQSVYYQGLCKVQSLVKQHGPEILMQLPRKWRQYS